MDPIARIRKINEEKAAEQQSSNRHAELVTSVQRTQEVIAQSFQILVDYLDQKVGKTEVVNQLKEVGTPDALKVADAVDSLHETIKSREKTDLTEITAVMRELLVQTKQIPKELPEQKEAKVIDYTKQMKALLDAVSDVQKAVQKQKLVAEAPVVKPADVHVKAPDLKPLQGSMDKVIKAVEKNKPLDDISTTQKNSLITEEFDEYKLVYDDFEDEEPRVDAIQYYFKGKKVARVNYTYNDDGMLVGAKKVSK